MENATEVSKFLSFVLRHQPEHVDVSLDTEGWADIDKLIAGAAARGINLELVVIQAVVNDNEK